jgi:hypothetical protein
MNSLKYYLKKAYRMPKKVLLFKIYNLLSVKISLYFYWVNDFFIPTYSNRKLKLSHLNFYLNAVEYDLDANFVYACENYLDHNFDLLGSGWINVDLKNSNPGLQSPDNTYNFIDWHCDFISKYSWNKSTWYKSIKYGNAFGVDVKVPWELSRLQHLPQLALFYNFNLGKKIITDKIVDEFKCQVLDFINSNPPRFGVNWVCTMDVGIRAANLVIAFELFESFGANFDDDFIHKFSNSLFDHGNHIINNLEWSEELTSNHYYANIAGLLFLSAKLNCSESNDWLYFSINELFAETKKQFYSDGMNFEASTAYHRLTSEMLLYSFSLLSGFGSDHMSRLKGATLKNYNNYNSQIDLLKYENYNLTPKWLVDVLYKSLKFTQAIQKTSGEIPQIGDNDSGRFLKFSIPGEIISSEFAINKYLNLKSRNYNCMSTEYLDENILNHNTLTIALKTIFEEKINFSSNMEEFVILCLTKGNKYGPIDNYSNSIANAKKMGSFKKELTFKKRYEFNYEIESGYTNPLSLERFFFEKSGVYVFKSKGFYLIVSAGTNGQNGNGGHAHNDRLSFELEIEGNTIFKDPGTCLYTPNPELRNKFRSTLAHNSIITEFGEPNKWQWGKFGLFSISDDSTCRLIDYADNSITLEMACKSYVHRRVFTILKDRLIIDDSCDIYFEQNFGKFEFYSNGYGKLLKN